MTMNASILTVWRPVLAIDPSLAGCAVARAAMGAPTYEKRFKTPPATGVEARVKRYRAIVDPIVELARQGDSPPLVVIEGYSFGSAQQGAGHHDRAEFGGILRDRLLPCCQRIVEVPPATLKKYATGKGNAKKPEVVSALSIRYGKQFSSDDQADAWALLQIGLCLVGAAEPETKPQQEVVEAIRKGMAAQ